MPDPEEIKQGVRAMWSAGDYPEIATTIEDVSGEAVEAAGTGAGADFLDVATGSGNAALSAARLGARVTGIDLTPDLLTVARRRAEEEGLEITFEEGDAEHLPYADASFDQVVSVFGAMFAPDQEQTAAELMRVRRAGGTIVVAAWTPDGLNGRLFSAIARHVPPPPEGFKAPVLWGVEDHVRGLFSSAGSVTCEVRRAENAVRADSADAWLDHLERALGPIILAKQALGERWPAARADLRALFDTFNEADDGSLHARPEYLLTVVD